MSLERPSIAPIGGASWTEEAKDTLIRLPTMAVDVTTLHEQHPKIRAQDWRSPLVLRLLGAQRYSDGKASITDSFRANGIAPVTSTLDLEWAGLQLDFDQCLNSYQAPVLTEFATLGLACILLTRHTDYRISEVTRRGERVDYWIGNDTNRRLYVLEVGGQQTGSIDTLTEAKTEQLNDNPFKRAGFICVAVYASSAARLWFCTPGGAV